jgi:hypothetical protein
MEFLPVHREKRGGEGEREELGEEELEAARGRVEVAAPLNCRVGAGLQAQPLDGAEEPERFKPGSPRRRTPTSPSVLQPFAMEPEPDRPRKKPPLSTSSPPLHHVGPPASIFTELAGTPRSGAAAPG